MSEEEVRLVCDVLIWEDHPFEFLRDSDIMVRRDGNTILFCLGTGYIAKHGNLVFTERDMWCVKNSLYIADGRKPIPPLTRKVVSEYGAQIAVDPVVVDLRS